MNQELVQQEKMLNESMARIRKAFYKDETAFVVECEMAKEILKAAYLDRAVMALCGMVMKLLHEKMEDEQEQK